MPLAQEDNMRGLICAAVGLALTEGSMQAANG